MPESTPREQLLRLQKATFARLQEEKQFHQSFESKQLKTYQQRYEREISAFRRVSNKAELVEKVLGSDIVYCGDFHTLRQAQRTPIRILRSVVEKRKSVLLGLELVPENREKLANDYVRGRVSEQAFLEGIEYDRRWGFPWSHYHQLFDFVRKHRLRILGLNSDKSDQLLLEARDDLVADLIVDATLSHSDSLIFCLYGDLHLAESHIPGRVKLRLKSQTTERKALTIFQNSEPIYWELAERGLSDTVDVVEISPHKYCVLSAAPWVKWQSYHSWIEDHTDLLNDPNQYEEESEVIPDYYHQVLEMAERIARFLKIRPKGMEHFSVYTATDTKIIGELDRYCEECDRGDVPIEALIRAEIVENRSYYFPEHSILYLSDLSENRAGEKAGQIVAAKMDPNFAIFGNQSDIREIFYRLVLWEAIGFFGSRITNPKRKCDQYRDFEQLLIRTRKRRLRGRLRGLREAAKQVLAHRSYEIRRLRTGKNRGSPRKLFRLPPRQLFLAASNVGQILGDHLYFAMVSDRIPIDTIRELYSPLPKKPQAASMKYWHLAGLLPTRRPDQGSKEDRF